MTLLKQRSDPPLSVEAGIVEPITLSSYQLFRRHDAQVEESLDEAIERRSLPLLVRIDIALHMLTASGNAQAASWAKGMLAIKVRPALKALPALH